MYERLTENYHQDKVELYDQEEQEIKDAQADKSGE